MGMRILDLDPASDDEIKKEQVVAIDDPSQSYKITLEQLGNFVEGEMNLGTAAYADLTTSHSDSTAGSVLIVGDFGIGGSAVRAASVPSSSYDSIAKGLMGGMWTHLSGGNPFAYTITLLSDTGGTLHDTHLIFPVNPAGVISVRWDNADGTLTYQNLYTDTNKPTPAEIGAMASGSAYTKTESDARYLQMPLAGGVGDVAMVKLNNSDQFLHGSTVPGSSLSYASLQGDASGQDPDIITEAKTLSGTWRITGTLTSAGGAQYLTKLTTAIRIA